MRETIDCVNCTGEQLLASEIVRGAIKDWKYLVDKGRTQDCNFIELRHFFNSMLCEILLSPTEITGEYILEELEKYRMERLKI